MNDSASISTESKQAILAVEEALRALAKAQRALQMYLPNSPTRAQALEQARAAFGRIWGFVADVQLEIRESSLLWDSNVVYQDLERGTEGLPWLLHRDGLRALTLHAGFEIGELEPLLQVFQRARTAATDEDDLVTLLWVADLSGIEFRHVELEGVVDFALNDGDRGGQGVARSDQPRLAVPAAETAPPGEGPPPGFVRVEDFDTTLYFLEPREVSYLQDELKREYLEDQRQNALTILFDLVELPDAGDAPERALAFIDQLLLECLAAGDYEQVGYVLRESAATLRRGEHHDAVAETLRELPARLSEPAVMGQLLQALDEGTRAPVATLLENLFAELRPAALAPLVAWLGVATASPARAAIERASLRLAGAHTGELARLLEHDDTAIVRGALRVAAQLATPAAVPGLSRVLRGDDAKLRADAVAALADIGSPGALQALERGVDDADRDVRVAAYRAIAARRHGGALPRLAQALRRKELRAADLGEKMAVFEAYGTLCGDAGVLELDGLLNARGLLGAKEPPESRACAARALGLIGTPLAMDALQRAADTKDVVVRSAVTRAMRGSA
ncbi:MAG: HEAT repeat domain-containing protein [Gemmatimonadaceae bacterium]|nr:HEAT repeat domain-containing protein [Gemmatimonadaceae bacterium]